MKLEVIEVHRTHHITRPEPRKEVRRPRPRPAKPAPSPRAMRAPGTWLSAHDMLKADLEEDIFEPGGRPRARSPFESMLQPSVR